MGFHTWKLWTPGFGDYRQLFSADLLKLPSSDWMGTVSEQVSPEMFDWFQVRALAGPLEDIHRVVPKSLLHCLGCVSCWKVNLRPSPRSWALWTRFSLRISLYIALFSFPSTLTSPSVPSAEKHPDSMMLLPPCFTVGMVLSR